MQLNKFKIFLTLLTTMFVTVLCSSNISAQNDEMRLVLIGIVLDEIYNQPVANADVSLKDTGTGIIRSFTTQEDGHFYFKLESDKTYVLSAYDIYGNIEATKMVKTINKNDPEILPAMLMIAPRNDEEMKEPTLSNFIIEESRPIASPNYTKVDYKIQIGAFRQEISTRSPFYTKVDRPIELEYASNGFIRYMVTGFSTLFDAKSYKKRLQQRGYGKTFIVPYVNGSRENSKTADQVAREFGTN